MSGVGLVGRGAELARLTAVLAGDTGRAVVISGEPGVGKTALLEQACAWALADGWRVVRVLGVAAEEKFALGGLNQLVIGLSDCQAGLDESDRAVLAPVFSADASTAVSGLPLAASVLRLLEVAAQTQPVLLVVDDVHWLDSISVEVLGSVGRRLTHRRVRVLAARRMPYQSVFSATGWDDVVLAALDVADSKRLLERAGAVLSEATRATVLAAAAGNPLALAELPRFAGRIEYGPATLPLTDRLVAVFGGRTGELDADVRADLLRAALDGITAHR